MYVTMEPLVQHGIDLLWLPAAFILLGAAPAAKLVMRARLPAHLWLALACGAVSLASYVLFFFWFLAPAIGRAASWWALGAASLWLAWQCGEPDARRLLRQRDVWLPALWLLLVLVAYTCLL